MPYQYRVSSIVDTYNKQSKFNTTSRLYKAQAKSDLHSIKRNKYPSQSFSQNLQSKKARTCNL